MPGILVRALKRSQCDIPASVPVNTPSTEVPVAVGLNVSQYREMVLVARLHSVTWPSTNAKIDIRVRPSAPTDEDPALNFRGTGTVAVVTLSQPSAAGTVVFSALATGFPAFVDVTVQWSQGQAAAAGTATISADLSLKS